MKIKPFSSVFSVRIETDILEAIEDIAAKRMTNRNSLIKDLMLTEIYNSKKKSEESFTKIPLCENVENIFYKRDFFTREDAELVFQGKWLLLKEEDKFMMLSEPTPEEKEQEIQNFLLTGIKYEFNNGDFNLYSSFDFTEDRNDSGNPILLLGNTLYAYNKITNVFEDYTSIDYFPINIKK